MQDDNEANAGPIVPSAISDDATPVHSTMETDSAQPVAADDSLLGVVSADAALPFAQIDATLDFLASSPDLADLPPLDWDLSG